VPVLFLALVLASMVEPSNWPRAMRVETYGRTGVTPGRALGNSSRFVRIPFMCALQDSAAAPV
jgi:hypothetical protein